MSYGVSYGVYVGFGEILWYFYKAWIGFLKSFLRGFSRGLFFLEGFLEILLEGFLKILREGFFFLREGFLEILLEGFSKISREAFFLFNFLEGTF